MDWAQVKEKDPIYLNLGGGSKCHPKPGYENYISIDLDPTADWSVLHDLRDTIPLPDGSVSRIHSEDFFEHVAFEDMSRLLAECYRLLKRQGSMRIGVPDYGNPKDRSYLEKGSDPRLPLHVTLTDYPLMKELVEQSSFEDHRFYHFWDGDTFTEETIDYSMGFIERTPDNDSRCSRRSIYRRIKGGMSDCLFMLSRGFRFSQVEMLTRKGHHLHVTSIVLDLFKT